MKKARKNRYDPYNNTRLMNGVREESECMRKLIKSEEKALDDRNDLNRTALMEAVSAVRPDVVKMLVQAGANVNLQDNRGDTGLMVAIREIGNSDSSDYQKKNCYMAIIKTLLLAGSDPLLKNEEQENALDLAKKLDFHEVADMVERHIALWPIFLGLHKRIGADSSVFRAYQNDLYERLVFWAIGNLIAPQPFIPFIEGERTLNPSPNIDNGSAKALKGESFREVFCRSNKSTGFPLGEERSRSG
jgi:hypothetical protein